jgi:type II secretory pathway component PulM
MNLNLNLDERQRKIAFIVGAALAVVLFLWVVVLPRLGIGGLDDQIATKENELREMSRLYKNFDQVKRDFTRIDSQIQRNRDLSLLSELSSIAERLNIKQGIDSMISKPKPKNDFYEEEAVEIRLQKVTLEELTRLLYEVEQSPKVLRVRKMHVETRFDDMSLLNVTLEVSAFKRLET